MIDTNDAYPVKAGQYAISCEGCQSSHSEPPRSVVVAADDEENQVQHEYHRTKDVIELMHGHAEPAIIKATYDTTTEI